MNEPQTPIYEFGDFRLDAAKRLLLKGVDEIVPLMPKAFDTLLYLVRHSGRVVEKDELMSEIWADTIVEENNLTQNISVLRRVFGEKPGEHRFIVTVPGHGYKFVADVKVSSSKFQVSSSVDSEISNLKLQNKPENNNESETGNRKPETDEDQRPKTENRKPTHFWLVAGFGAVIIGLSLLGFYTRLGNEKSVHAQIKTVAVLPFKSLVAEKRDEALELGMADTLISKLGGGEEITVRPLSAIRRYNSVEQDSLIAGRELNVEAVLDGTIQTSGGRIRVSAKLLRTGDGKQLWTGQFDEKFTDIFAVQDAISERVAAALKIRLGNAEKKRPTENVEAYQLYMKGRFHASRLILPEARKGIEYFNQAIALDADYALAYVGIAQAYTAFSLSGDVPANDAMPKAKTAALRAVELNPNLPESHVAAGLVEFWYEWNWKEAENKYQRALELDLNNAPAHYFYAHLNSNLGRHAEALRLAKRARELDPLSLITNSVEGQFLFFAGQTEEAVSRLNKTLELDPNFWHAHLILSGIYAENRQFPEAVAEAEKAAQVSGENSQAVAVKGYALAKSGNLAEARAVLERLRELSKTRYVPAYNFAIIYNALGETETTLDYLEKAFAEKNVLMVFLKVEPKWNNLRKEPRFLDLMRRMNFE